MTLFQTLHEYDPAERLNKDIQTTNAYYQYFSNVVLFRGLTEKRTASLYGITGRTPGSNNMPSSFLVQQIINRWFWIACIRNTKLEFPFKTTFQ